MEMWLPVAGFEGQYEVSNFGRVRACKRTCQVTTEAGSQHIRVYAERLLKLCKTQLGYPIVYLRNRGKKYAKKVHILVAEAFLGPRPDGHLIRHLDGNVSNNCPSNLAYGTPRENNLDRVLHGNTRLSVEDVAAIRGRISSGETHRSISKSYGVSRALITHINMGRIYAHV